MFEEVGLAGFSAQTTQRKLYKQGRLNFPAI